MPGFGSLLKVLGYAPWVMEIIRAVRPQQAQPEAEDAAVAAVASLRKGLEARLDALEREMEYLRERVKAQESLLTTLQLMVYVGFSAAVVLGIIALVLAATRH
jgi:hypothetical protein